MANPIPCDNCDIFNDTFAVDNTDQVADCDPEDPITWNPPSPIYDVEPDVLSDWDVCNIGYATFNGDDECETPMTDYATVTWVVWHRIPSDDYYLVVNLENNFALEARWYAPITFENCQITAPGSMTLYDAPENGYCDFTAATCSVAVT